MVGLTTGAWAGLRSGGPAPRARPVSPLLFDPDGSLAHQDSANVKKKPGELASGLRERIESPAHVPYFTAHP